ncbi:hypothetical protein HPP92_024808, partial [Vanilla planifolia]
GCAVLLYNDPIPNFFYPSPVVPQSSRRNGVGTGFPSSRRSDGFPLLILLFVKP